MIIFAYFAVIALAFFLLIVRPQRRRMAAHRALVEALTVGDEVVTTGGIFGTIRGIDDDRVELEVAPGVAITVARAAIAQSVNPPDPPPSAPADPLAVEDHPADNHPADNHPADNGSSDD